VMWSSRLCALSRKL